MIPRTPVKKARKKPRPGRLKRAAMKLLRELVFERDGGRCVNCGVALIQYPESIFHPRAYHLAHVRNKAMWQDSLENCVAKCSRCHLVLEHQYGPSFQKPCPPKPKEVA